MSRRHNAIIFLDLYDTICIFTDSLLGCVAIHNLSCFRMNPDAKFWLLSDTELQLEFDERLSLMLKWRERRDEAERLYRYHYFLFSRINLYILNEESKQEARTTSAINKG